MSDTVLKYLADTNLTLMKNNEDARKSENKKFYIVVGIMSLLLALSVAGNIYQAICSIKNKPITEILMDANNNFESNINQENG